MPDAHTTDELWAEVQDQAQLPDADGRITQAQALKFARKELRTTISKLLIGTRAGHWVQRATDQNIVSGTALYNVPERALASGTASVLIADSTEEWDCPYIPDYEAWRYRDDHGGWHSPYAHTFRDNQIELLPVPQVGNYFLRVLYPIEPPRLVPVSSCAVVASASGTTITTAATVPTAWGANEGLDAINAGTGRIREMDLAGTSISGTSITVVAGVGSVAANDYIALDGESCVPPIPSVAWPVLVDATTLRVCRALGDQPNITASVEKQLAQSYREARDLLSPRNRGASEHMVAYNSPLRRGWRRR